MDDNRGSFGIRLRTAAGLLLCAALGGCGWATAAIVAAASSGGGGGSSGGGGGGGNFTAPTWPSGDGLTVTGTTSSTISLSWNAAVDDATPQSQLRYRIWWSTTSPVDTNRPDDWIVNNGGTSVTLNGFANSTQYFFRIQAGDEFSNFSADSSEVSGTTTGPPDSTPPTFGGATGATAMNPYAIELQWAAGSDGVTPTAQLVYDVYIATATGTQNFTNPPATTSDPGALTTVLGELQPSTQYFIVVRARDLAGNSDGNTAEVTATTPAAAALTVAATGSLPSGRDNVGAAVLSDGRVLVAGGFTTSTTAQGLLYDPATGTWTATTNSLGQARYGPVIVVMENQQAIACGGQSGSTQFANTDIYDPTTGTWTNGGTLGTARVAPNGVRLQNGRVLIAAGQDASGPSSAADLYDPGTGTWTVTGSLVNGRYSSAATLLPNGRVLISGGVISGTPNVETNTCELYDPATGTWTLTGAMGAARFEHTSTLLPNGMVLVAGGETQAPGYLAGAELYDPSTGTWAAAGNMSGARTAHSAVLLPHGRVLITGGRDPGTGPAGLTTTEIYDARTGNWANGPTLTTGRFWHSSVVLTTGQAMVISGNIQSSRTATCELIDARAPTWRSATGLGTNRAGPADVVLPDGRVLLAGGNGGGGAVQTAQLYDPATGTFSNTGNMQALRVGHEAVLLQSGQVLAVAGQNTGPLTSTELYDPATGTWTLSGSLTTSRAGDFGLAMLRDGRVLVSGGESSSGRQSSCELYDPVTGTWTSTGSMNAVRVSHTLTLLPNGHVLAVGGADTTNHHFSTETYDPATGTWTNENPMANNRHSHAAALLPNGQVLVIGGHATAPTGPGFRSSCELFNPATGTWTATGALATATSSLSCFVTPDGHALLAGGVQSGSVYTTTSTVYDPAQGTWLARSGLQTGRYQSGMAVLSSNAVLYAGGQNGGGAMSSAELQDAGLGSSSSRRPRIDTVAGATVFPVTLRPTDTITITGVRFRGTSASSSGKPQGAASDTPVVTLQGPLSGNSHFRGHDTGRTIVLASGGFASGTQAVVTLPQVYDAAVVQQGIGEGYYYLRVTANGIPSEARIVRVQADGALDSTFGVNGVVTTNPSTGTDQVLHSTNDGTSLFLAGSDASTGGGQWHIEKRSLATGALDTGFNTTGIVTTNPGAGLDQPHGITHDGTSLYIIGEDTGPGNPQWRIEKRLISTGALVTAFNSTGIVTTNPSSGADIPYAMVHDGTSLYIVGQDSAPGAAQWRIEKRSMTTGALDGTFGGGTGIIQTNPSSGPDVAYAVASDGTNLYIVGYDAGPAGTNLQARVEKRLMTTGALVTAFNSTGVVTVALSTGVEQYQGVSVDASNLYLIGDDQVTGNTRWMIEKRSLTSGALDSTFGSGTGRITVNPSSGWDDGREMVVSGTALYCVGYDVTPGNEQWRIEKRNTGTGALITTFGVSGVLLSDPSNSGDTALHVTADATHLYVVGGDQVPGAGNYQWRIEKRTK